mmetsp:Transcript_40059/g.73953  ORF Transcript_40059/g.73953 Transcript_40059/m.73953 type:complete len:235 (-) Transcript_40059:451-1155(-)
MRSVYHKFVHMLLSTWSTAKSMATSLRPKRSWMAASANITSSIPASSNACCCCSRSFFVIPATFFVNSDATDLSSSSAPSPSSPPSSPAETTTALPLLPPPPAAVSAALMTTTKAPLPSAPPPAGWFMSLSLASPSCCAFKFLATRFSRLPSSFRACPMSQSPCLWNSLATSTHARCCTGLSQGKFRMARNAASAANRATVGRSMAAPGDPLFRMSLAKLPSCSNPSCCTGSRG